jgi:site-specific DNA-methyltransferase (adenine-specific)
MTLPINKIICGDCLEVMKDWPDGCVDLIITSPPYDNLRQYDGHSTRFGGAYGILSRALKHGGVIVWICGDAVIDGSETGSSFWHAIGFMAAGLRLHDTMIYHRQAANPDSTRYWQNFEYMFILSNGKPKTVNLIRDRKNKYHKMGGDNVREKDGTITKRLRSGIKFEEYGVRENIWYYGVGKGNSSKEDIAFQHPAIFPEQLAADHIKSWSNTGDIVVDPFSGSGTTAKMAKMLGRNYIGIDISEKYCNIARKRLEAVDTGVPVKERDKGQMPLFGAKNAF